MFWIILSNSKYIRQIDTINPFIQKPSFSSSLSPNSSMALFHSYTLPHHRLLSTLSPFSSKPHSLTTTTHFNNTPLSISTPPRKLLCKPPQGKYVRQDYLVVSYSQYLSFLNTNFGSMLFFPPINPMLKKLNLFFAHLLIFSSF